MYTALVLVASLAAANAITRSYYFSGYDPTIQYSEELSGSLQTPLFLQVQAEEERLLHQRLAAAHYGAVNVDVNRFYKPTSDDIHGGIVFNARVTLTGASLPTATAFQTAVSGTRTKKTREEEKEHGTERQVWLSWHIFSVSVPDERFLDVRAVPKQVPLGRCLNGGSMLLGGYCYCTPYWTGFFCELPVCVNGGRQELDVVGLGDQGGDPLSSHPYCDCPPGYAGLHCEERVCTPPTEASFTRQNKRTLVIARSARSTMDPVFAQLPAAASKIINYYNTEKAGYFDSFAYTEFIGGAVGTTNFNYIISLSAYTTDAADFVTNVLTTKLLTIPEQSCKQPNLAGVHHAVTDYKVHPKSTVFLFTDTENLNVRLAFGEPRISSAHAYDFRQIISLMPVATGCPAYDPTSADYLIMENAAATTMGHVVNLAAPADVPTLMDNLKELMYARRGLLMDEFPSCAAANNVQRAFSVEPGQTVYITATSTLTTISLAIGNGAPAPLVPTSTVGDLNVFKVAQPVADELYHLTLAATATTRCGHRVWGRADPAHMEQDIDLFLSFSRSSNNDVSFSDVLQGETFLPSARITDTANPANVQVVHKAEIAMYITSAASTPFYQETSLERSGCNFNLQFSRGYTCTTPGPFIVTVHGNDTHGNSYQRTRVAACLPTPAKCLNGGIIFDNGRCYCPPFFKGERCELHQCVNEGFCIGGHATDTICPTSPTSPPVNARCNCSTGFSGDHCEQVSCKVQNAVPNFGPNARTMTFVIQNSITMAFDIQQIREGIVKFVREAKKQHVDWIAQWVLITFTDNVVQKKISTFDSSAFVREVKRMDIDINVNVKCPKMTLEAVNEALALQVRGIGEIFVFTDSIANYNRSIPQHKATANRLFNQLEQTQATINILLTDSNPCLSYLVGDGAEVLNQIAQLSRGNRFIAKKNKVTEFLGFIPNLYQSDLVLTLPIPDCSHGVSVTFPIDSHTRAFTFIVYGFKPTIQLTTPSSQAYPTFGILNDTDGTLHIVRAYQGQGGYQPGNWQASVQTLATVPVNVSFGCTIQVRAQSGIQMYTGFTLDDVRQDFPRQNPYFSSGFSATNWPVVHMDNMPPHADVEIFRIYTDAGAPYRALTLSRRGNCAYEYYGGHFGCPYADRNVNLLVQGTDDLGYTIQRMAAVRCHTPPGPQCDLSQVAYDIIFMIDKSAHMGQTRWEQVKKFMKDFIFPYDISPTTTQVAIMGVGAIATPLSQLNTIEDKDRMINFMGELPWTIPGNGRNVLQALQVLQGTIMVPQHGYRPNAKHVAVLFLSDTWTGPDPVALAAQLRQQGMHIIGVGIGSDGPIGDLTHLAGGKTCAYAARDERALNNFIPYLQSKTCETDYCG